MGAVALLRFRRRKKGKYSCVYACEAAAFQPFPSILEIYLNNILVLLTYLHQNTATLFKPGLEDCFKSKLHAKNMHQTAPLTTSKCKKLSLWEGGHPLTHPPPLARSARSGTVASLPRRLFFTAPLKLNPGYATGSERSYLIKV